MSETMVVTIVTGLVTVTTTIVSFLTIWVKLKYGADQTKEAIEKTKTVEQKIDTNTALTKAGAHKASENAEAAATAAKEAKEAVASVSQKLDEKLNGGVHAAIEAAVSPLRAAFEDHVLQDDANMVELRKLFEDLKKRIK